MGLVTQKAVAETKQAIWDFNPNHDDSLVSGGLDIISILRTLCVKVSISQLLPRSCTRSFVAA